MTIQYIFFVVLQNLYKKIWSNINISNANILGSTAVGLISYFVSNYASRFNLSSNILQIFYFLPVLSDVPRTTPMTMNSAITDTNSQKVATYATVQSMNCGRIHPLFLSNRCSYLL